MTFQQVWLCGVMLIVSTWEVTQVGASARDARPFWTEKSAFIEGDELFVVGIASKAKTAEDGRQQAFERGKIELMNYAQVTTLEAKGLAIETQMTFEEPNADGSVTVYRLLRVPLEKLLAIQGRVQSQGKAYEEGLEKARRDLLVVRKSLSEKERQAETLLKALSTELRSKGLTPTQPTGSVVNDLKQAEGQLSKQDSDFELILIQARERLRLKEQERRAASRILTQKHSAICARLHPGMTKQEVRTLNGEPEGMFSLLNAYKDKWHYNRTYSDEAKHDPGLITVYFDPNDEVGAIWGCFAK